MNKLFLLVTVLFSTFIVGSAQIRPTDPKIFTQEDWDKLSQSEKDSINKGIAVKFEEARKSGETIDEANANQILESALQNVNGTTVLSFNCFPKK